jgi:hypothetical protein
MPRGRQLAGHGPSSAPCRATAEPAGRPPTRPEDSGRSSHRRGPHAAHLRHQPFKRLERSTARSGWRPGSDLGRRPAWRLHHAQLQHRREVTANSPTRTPTIQYRDDVDHPARDREPSRIWVLLEALASAGAAIDPTGVLVAKRFAGIREQRQRHR